MSDFFNPGFSTVVGPFDAADGPQEVVTRVNGQALRWVSVTANKAGAHGMGINSESPLLTVTDTDTVKVDLENAAQGLPLQTQMRYRAASVFVLAGANDTSFTIEGTI